MNRFEDIRQFYRNLNVGEPQHPYIDIRTAEEALLKLPNSFDPFQLNCYKIGLKKNFTGALHYGKTKYDTDKGLLLFIEPMQVLAWENLDYYEGFDLLIHPDLLRENHLLYKFQTYNFFSYDINESLFLTEAETLKLTAIFEQITEEMKGQKNIKLVLSLVEVILNYADIFYKRQFITRKEILNAHIVQFKEHLINYYNNNQTSQKPNAQYFAEKLHISLGYLNDLTKQYTNKTTTEFINDFIIEQSEILLKHTDYSIAEISYKLGFENPPYFTRLFKKKRNLPPNEYRRIE